MTARAGFAAAVLLVALASSGVEYLMLTFLTTLAFAALPLTWLEVLGGDNGLTVTGGLQVSFGLNPLVGFAFYWFVLGVVVVCASLAWFVLASQTGKAIQAIGRNPVRASAMGYNVGQYRVALTLFASVIASIGGWLYSLQTSFVFIDLLGLTNSTNGLVYALVGGVSTILGPLIGAAALRSLTEQLSRGTTSQLYVGIVLLLVVYFIPDGVVGLWQRYRPGRPAAKQVHPEPASEPAAAEAL